jgi:hypothetical protein
VTAPDRVADFLAAVAHDNPFARQRVARAGSPAIDVPEIHAGPFLRLVELAKTARRENRAIGVTVWAELGAGKSHLLARLERWAADDFKACFVSPYALQVDADDQLARSVLRDVVAALTAGPGEAWHETPLYRLVQTFIATSMPAAARTRSFREAEGHFHRLARTLGGEGRAVRSPVWGVLFEFFRSAYLGHVGRGEGLTAGLAARWLSGDTLDPEESTALGLRSAHGVGTVLPNRAEVMKILAALGLIAAQSRRPVILAFDQIHTLSPGQISLLSKFLHELLDSSRNLLVVLSEVQDELLRLVERKVISPASWDRLGEYRIDLGRLTTAEGRQIVQARLDAFLRPFADVPEVQGHRERDPLFPLGSAWFADRLRELVDIRPRRLLQIASERWQQLQQSLTDPEALRTWAGAAEGPQPRHVEPARSPEEAIDAAVAAALTERLERHRQAPHKLPPNADNLRGLVEALLLAARDTDGIVPPVEAPKGGAYDLLVRRPGAPVGLVFLGTENANVVTHALRRLVEDEHPPAEVLLVTDARQPLALGKAPRTAGRAYLQQVQDRTDSRFEHVELPFNDYAALEALDAVARQAAELDVGAPATGPLRPRDVIASHLRSGRLTTHPLLGRLLAGPAPL